MEDQAIEKIKQHVEAIAKEIVNHAVAVENDTQDDADEAAMEARDEARNLATSMLSNAVDDLFFDRIVSDIIG